MFVLFKSANEAINIPEKTSVADLKTLVDEKIYRLIQHKFADYLNLLYSIDGSESIIKKLDGSDSSELSGQVVFLILKRELQKVWFRNQY